MGVIDKTTFPVFLTELHTLYHEPRQCNVTPLTEIPSANFSRLHDNDEAFLPYVIIAASVLSRLDSILKWDSIVWSTWNFPFWLNLIYIQEW